MNKALVLGAEWCAPCKQMKSQAIPELIAEGYDIKLYDVEQGSLTEEDSGQGQAAKYQVRGVPTIVILSDEGERLSLTTGFKTTKQFRELLEL